jgi:hypothetical protein
MMLTAKTIEQRRREQEDMARAIRAYTGPVTKCPPGKAETKRGWMPELRSLRQRRRHAKSNLDQSQ